MIGADDKPPLEGRLSWKLPASHHDHHRSDHREAALPEEVTAIHTELFSTPGVDRVIHLRTLHLGPEELLVAAKIAIGTADRGVDVAATIDDAEARIRRVLPIATAIYLEPDIDRQPTSTGAAPA